MATDHQPYANDRHPIIQTARQLDAAEAWPVKVTGANPYDIMSGATMNAAMRELMGMSLTSSEVNYESITRFMTYTMGNKLYTQHCSLLSQTPLGLHMAHHATGEAYKNLQYFNWHYLLNRTPPATEAQKNVNAPAVKIEQVVRNCWMDGPLSVMIPVDKEVYVLIKKTLERLCGMDMADRYKIYVGEGVDAWTLLFKTILQSYLSTMSMRAKFAATSLIQGEVIRQIMFTYVRSPVLYTMPPKDVYMDKIAPKEWTEIINRHYFEYLFSLNKLWRIKREKGDLPQWLEEVCRRLHFNTSKCSTPEFEPSFANCPFTTIEGIVMVTPNIYQLFAKSGLLKVARGASMTQKFSYCILTEADMNPINTRAPQHLYEKRNGSYMKNEDGTLMTHNVTTHIDLPYLDGPEGALVVVNIHDGDLGSNHAALRIGMKQMTRFDEMIPCGFVFKGFNGPPNKLHAVPQTTFFPDMFGSHKALSVQSAKDFLKSCYNWCYAQVDQTHYDIQTILNRPRDKTMLSWDSLNYREFASSFPFSHLEMGAFKMNRYVVQNKWFCKEIFVANIVHMHLHRGLFGNTDEDATMELSVSEQASRKKKAGVVALMQDFVNQSKARTVAWFDCMSSNVAGMTREMRKAMLDAQEQMRLATTWVASHSFQVSMEYFRKRVDSLTSLYLWLKGCCDVSLAEIQDWVRKCNCVLDSVTVQNIARLPTMVVHMRSYIRRCDAKNETYDIPRMSLSDPKLTTGSKYRVHFTPRLFQTKTEPMDEANFDFLGRIPIPEVPDNPNYSDFLMQQRSAPVGTRDDVVMAALVELGLTDSTQVAFRRAKSQLLQAYFQMLEMKNEDYADFLPKGINPGVAVQFIKPQYVESESMVFSRPCGMTHIMSNPSIEKELDMSDDQNQINFTFYQASAHTINGLSNTSVKMPASLYVNKPAAETERVINPAEDDRVLRLLDSLADSSPEEYAATQAFTDTQAWWPVLWQPYVPASMFDTGVSPMGRSTGQWLDEESFSDFFSHKVSDIFYRSEFSANKVCTNMRYNLNTLVPMSQIMHHSEYPLNKYLSYNPNWANAVTDAIKHHTRRVEGPVPAGSSGTIKEIEMPMYPDDNEVSKIMTVALPRRCWTNHDLLNEQDQNKRNPSPYARLCIVEDPKSNHFFYPGNEALEKFDNGQPLTVFTV